MTTLIETFVTYRFSSHTHFSCKKYVVRTVIKIIFKLWKSKLTSLNVGCKYRSLRIKYRLSRIIVDKPHNTISEWPLCGMCTAFLQKCFDAQRRMFIFQDAGRKRYFPVTPWRRQTMFRCILSFGFSYRRLGHFDNYKKIEWHIQCIVFCIKTPQARVKNVVVTNSVNRTKTECEVSNCVRTLLWMIRLQKGFTCCTFYAICKTCCFL